MKVYVRPSSLGETRKNIEVVDVSGQALADMTSLDQLTDSEADVTFVVRLTGLEWVYMPDSDAKLPTELGAKERSVFADDLRPLAPHEKIVEIRTHTYQATDGKVFGTPQEACQYQVKIDG